MKRTRWIGVGLGVSAFALALVVPMETPAQKKPAPKAAVATSSFENDVAPIITKYCVSCHSSGTAGVTLKKDLTATQALKSGPMWSKIAKNISNKHMPPEGTPAPTDEQRRKLVAWVDKAFAQDCKLADPGKVTIRRLNREEYNNTVRDLLGVTIRPADDFPSDDVGYGFDNIGDVLSMSPLLMEKYLAASEKLMRAAIRIPKTKIQTVDVGSMKYTGGAGPNGNSMILSSYGTVSGMFKAPSPGWYRIRVRAGQQYAGGENAKLEVKLNRDRITEFELKNSINDPWNYETPVKITPGDYSVNVTFTNDYFLPAQNGKKAEDRNVSVFSIEFIGPVEDNAIRTPFQTKLIPQIPPSENWNSEAKKALQGFATKAYRRPVTPEELDRLMLVFNVGARSGEGYERAMQIACQAVLCNPNFLYRVELDGSAQVASRDLTGYEVASRLSYFLWSSMPDDTLLALAKSGELLKPAILDAQVNRMMQDPKAIELVRNFGMQWLQLRKLQVFEPDKKMFPTYTANLVNSMVTETQMFLDTVMRQDLPITEFIDSKFTYLNEPLAKHYGIAGVTGEEFRKVSTEGTGRGGVLTQASVLAVTSNPTRTSPTKRGRWILEQILGSPPPPPPPGVDDLKEQTHLDAKMSLRQMMEEHRKNPACATCHIRMDALGFGFENYNAIGQWRTKDGTLTIDASADLPGGRKFNGATALKKILLENKKEFAHNFTEKMMTFALGRGVDDVDKCAVDTITKDSAASGYKFSTIVKGIVNSDPFKKRKVEKTK
jgi:cytochrome c5